MILVAIAVIFGLLGFACAIASLVFFVMVVMQMLWLFCSLLELAWGVAGLLLRLCLPLLCIILL